MSLSPEQIELLAEKHIIGIYQTLESEVIADIARRVNKTMRLTETAELQVKSMVEAGYSADAIYSAVMKQLNANEQYKTDVAINTLEYKQFVRAEIQIAEAEAKKQGNKLVAEAGDMSWNNDLSMWKQAGQDLSKPTGFSQLIDAYKAQTANTLKNLTGSTGFKGTAIGTVGVVNAYNKMLDVALVRLTSGTFSIDQTVKSVVKDLAASGLRSIDYASGRSWQLDTASRMCVRTAMSQLSGKITEMNIAKTGVHLVITSQHAGARPEHVPWQNKVFTYSGKPTKQYPDFFKETGYGTVTGLKGANCTHEFYPFWEGISDIPEDIEEPEDVVIDGKTYDLYQATQHQRALERAVRATKREIEATKALKEDTSTLKRHLSKQQQEYYAFCNSANLKPFGARLQVQTGTSNLSRTFAYQKHNNLLNFGIKKKVKTTSSQGNVIKYISAKTYEEAKNYAKTVLNLDYENMDKVNIDVANAINSEITKAYNLFGDLSKQGTLSGVRIYPKKEEWYAAYAPKWKELWFRNITAKNSLKKMQQEAQFEYDSGIWSTSCAEHSIRHELGHSVEYTLSTDQLSKIEKIRKSIMDSIGLEEWSKEPNDVDKYAPLAKEAISYYGLCNTGELIAECIAEYLAGNPRKVAKQVVNIIIGK